MLIDGLAVHSIKHGLANCLESLRAELGNAYCTVQAVQRLKRLPEVLQLAGGFAVWLSVIALRMFPESGRKFLNCRNIFGSGRDSAAAALCPFRDCPLIFNFTLGRVVAAEILPDASNLYKS